MRRHDDARGARICKLRNEHQPFVSQEDLAHALAVHPRTVQDWEAGKAPSRRNLSALADYFATTVAYLEHGVDGASDRAVRFRRAEREMRAQILEAWAERGTGTAEEHAELDRMLDRFRELLGLPGSGDEEEPPAHGEAGH